jgi:hypothetical protein
MNWLLLTSILLAWNSDPNVDSYKVHVSSGTFSQDFQTEENRVTLNLSSGAEYAFAVTAKNSVGESDPSETVSFTPGVLMNISTRGQVGTGDNVMIAGFIVSGQSPRTVLIRAIGPSLPLKGTLADPSITLSNGESNDNWGDAPNSAQIPLGLIPGSPKESAILTTLQPGPYTVIVRGVNNTSGLALVEVYDITK